MRTPRLAVLLVALVAMEHAHTVVVGSVGDAETCREAGFTAALVCSSCSKVCACLCIYRLSVHGPQLAVIADLHADCLKCCTLDLSADEEEPAVVKFASAVLAVCS